MKMQPIPKNKVVWAPIPGSSQELALDTRCDVTLYTGSRGPGKTDTQLMRFRRNVGKGYGSSWRGVIFDRAYKNLDDLIAKSKRWFPRFEDGCKFLSGSMANKWVWPTGEELEFRALKREDDYWNYHGQEYPFIGWNELTKFAFPTLFDMMFSCNRSSWTQAKDSAIDKSGNYLTPPIPLEVFATCNPSGVGHTWVKKRFIDPIPYGHVLRQTVEVFDPAIGQDTTYETTQVAIFGTYRENIYLSKQYVASLNNNPDPNLRAAWLYGDWDITAGGALDDLWRKSVHVLPRFVVPEGWAVDRSLDWGSTHPFSVGWWAEANGEEATMPNGAKFCPPPGTLVQCAEIYGTKEIGTNKGLRMGSTDMALLIKRKEKQLIENEWVPNNVRPGPADNQIDDVKDASEDTIAERMRKEGVSWTKSDKSPGSRKNGLQLIRDRLLASLRGEGPGLYFMDNCRASIATIPVLQYDEDKPDDIDTLSEDHPYDMTRYRVLAGPKPRAAAIRLTA